ncbi:hypothetical protein [Gimesia panareensis]|uniref:hypothetical protein n=1 Tax=Gimesia panareensis TaxID=2527978 RepID=UPI00118CD703|nr:hypothetical protein [Gimesia panareensis]QDU53610.1 hypothetical protein Pan110_60040 [Gimesia panareensis]
MILQSLRKHRITQPNIHPWNSSRKRYLLGLALALGLSPFCLAGAATAEEDPFLGQTKTSVSTWEELKSRSPEARWESLSRESKRELKKQERKERREQRKQSKNEDEQEFAAPFRPIPDDMPVAPTVGQPAATGVNPFATARSSTVVSPAPAAVPAAESFKTIGLAQKPSVAAPTQNVPYNSVTAAPAATPSKPIVPVFPESDNSSSNFVTTQKSYEELSDDIPSVDGVATEPEDLEDETPHLLRKISVIKPFFDYEPDPEIAKNEPCRNLCPRPDGKPCKASDKEGVAILECPREFKLSHEPYPGRNFTESIYTWEASNVNYNPLYFEDPNLERYGLSRRDVVQPFVSIGRFTGQLIALPYQMSIDPLRKRMYPLGYYRPGEANTPKRINGIPWNTKAALTEGLTATGLVFILP